MQLGATKVVASSSIPDWAEEAAAEFDTPQTNPWGNDDLMDVNADEDDWSGLLGMAVTCPTSLTMCSGPRRI